MKNILVRSLIVIVFVTIAFASDVTKSKQPLRITPSFNWSSQTTNSPGSAKMTLGVISPSYLVQWRGEIPEPYKSFRQDIEGDMMELLTNKGFTVRGPFEARDEMILADKKACDLLLTVEIEPLFQSSTGGWQTEVSKSTGIGYYFKGSISVYGKINLVASEPLSGEKLWSKSLEIPTKTTPEIKSMVGVDQEDLLYLIQIDNTVANAITERLIEPEELQSLQGEIDRLKKSRE